MWTEVQNPRRFRVGEEDRYSKGNLTMTLHKHGFKGWILKEYRGKYFVLTGSWRSVKHEWNEIIKSRG